MEPNNTSPAQQLTMMVQELVAALPATASPTVRAAYDAVAAKITNGEQLSEDDLQLLASEYKQLQSTRQMLASLTASEPQVGEPASKKAKVTEPGDLAGLGPTQSPVETLLGSKKTTGLTEAATQPSNKFHRVAKAASSLATVGVTLQQLADDGKPLTAKGMAAVKEQSKYSIRTPTRTILQCSTSSFPLPPSDHRPHGPFPTLAPHPPPIPPTPTHIHTHTPSPSLQRHHTPPAPRRTPSIQLHPSLSPPPPP